MSHVTGRSIFGLSFATWTLFAVAATADAQELDPRLRDFRIDGLMRFDTREEAERRREQLVRFIWDEGLPSRRPEVSENIGNVEELASVEPDLIRQIDRYDVDIGGFGFHSEVFVAHPSSTDQKPRKLAIVHPGHMRDGSEHYLEAGLSLATETLLKHDYTVAVLQMPLVGWNHDNDGVLPSGESFTIESRGTRGHNEMFAKLEPTLKGATFRLFLEPIVQVTNEFAARFDSADTLLMIGLSGGGWTTHMSAAIDSRIDISIPVAGAMPLYARAFSPGSRGDAEQFHEPLYGEIDSDGDDIPDQATGVASWLEVFALGGIGVDDNNPRTQVQLLNFYDSCCFSGPVYETYEVPLGKRVAAIGTGKWDLYVDRSHRQHLISEEAIERVLVPLIESRE